MIDLLLLFFVLFYSSACLTVVMRERVLTKDFEICMSRRIKQRFFHHSQLNSCNSTAIRLSLNGEVRWGEVIENDFSNGQMHEEFLSFYFDEPWQCSYSVRFDWNIVDTHSMLVSKSSTNWPVLWFLLMKFSRRVHSMFIDTSPETEFCQKKKRKFSIGFVKLSRMKSLRNSLITFFT